MSSHEQGKNTEFEPPVEATAPSERNRAQRIGGMAMRIEPNNLNRRLSPIEQNADIRKNQIPIPGLEHRPY